MIDDLFFVEGLANFQDYQPLQSAVNTYLSAVAPIDCELVLTEYSNVGRLRGGYLLPPTGNFQHYTQYYTQDLIILIACLLCIVDAANL